MFSSKPPITQLGAGLLAIGVLAFFAPVASPQTIVPVVKPTPSGTNYTVNNGPGDQTQPRISGNLVSYTDFGGSLGPSNIRYHNLKAASTQGNCTASTGGQILVTCNLGALANGHYAVIGIGVKVTAEEGQTLINTATVSASSSDPNTANNSSTVSTPVK